MFLEPNHEGWVKLLGTSGSGVFENDDANIWSDFLRLLKFRAIDVEKTQPKDSADKCWCPSKVTSEIRPANSAIVSAVVSIVQSLGEDPSRKELLGTLTHFVKWLMNFKNSNLEIRLNRLGLGQMDVVKSNGDVNRYDECIHSELNLSFWSQCEHHLLPFYGVVHIGYICTEGVNPIGKPLLQSIVHFYSFKLQVQERLTRKIAETASLVLGGHVMVVVEDNHTCMVSRGIEKFESNTATVAVLGCFSTNPSIRVKFLESMSLTYFIFLKQKCHIFNIPHFFSFMAVCCGSRHDNENPEADLCGSCSEYLLVKFHMSLEWYDN